MCEPTWACLCGLFQCVSNTDFQRVWNGTKQCLYRFSTWIQSLTAPDQGQTPLLSGSTPPGGTPPDGTPQAGYSSNAGKEDNSPPKFHKGSSSGEESKRKAKEKAEEKAEEKAKGKAKEKAKGKAKGKVEELFSPKATQSELCGNRGSNEENHFDFNNLDNIKIIQIGSDYNHIVSLKFSHININTRIEEWTEKVGGNCGDDIPQIDLEDGEYISEVKGAYQRLKPNRDQTRISSLTFFINKADENAKADRTFGVSKDRLKSTGSEPHLGKFKHFTATPAKDGKIVGFYGSTENNYLSSIGFYAKKR